MPEARHRRTFKYHDVSFVISSRGTAKTLTVAGQPISLAKSDNHRYRTIHFTHAQYHDLETMAHALIEVYALAGRKAYYAGITRRRGVVRFRCPS
jgi:hypothetical protein